MSGKVNLPRRLATRRRAQLARLTRTELHAAYRALPGRAHVVRTLLSDAVLIDIVIWTEYSDRFRVGGRGGKG